MQQRVIHIARTAPPKPVRGAVCNGCGVCCLAEPCPLGMVWTRRRIGACRALQWDSTTGQYRCGVLARLGDSQAGGVGLWRVLQPWLVRWVRRWIGAGQGCDCDWEPDTRAGAAERVASSADWKTQPEEKPDGPK